MKFLLDTVVLSELRKTNRNPGVTAWVAQRQDNELFISVLSVGELERGIELQRNKDPEFAERLARWLDQLTTLYGERILPVTTAIAAGWGRLSAILGNSGADLLLAATALEHDLTIVTRNERHFLPAGVAVENPWT